MSTPRDIIIEPVVSEKSYDLIEENSYTFIVHPDATKPQIREAVEEIWGVRVVSVNTLNRKGKTTQNRFVRGQRPSRKRAVVKLALGDSIELFETR